MTKFTKPILRPYTAETGFQRIVEKLDKECSASNAIKISSEFGWILVAHNGAGFSAICQTGHINKAYSPAEAFRGLVAKLEDRTDA